MTGYVIYVVILLILTVTLSILSGMARSPGTWVGAFVSAALAGLALRHTWKSAKRVWSAIKQRREAAEEEASDAESAS